MRKFIFSAMIILSGSAVIACPPELRVQRSRVVHRPVRQRVVVEKQTIRQPIRRERIVVEEYVQPQAIRRQRIVEDDCADCQNLRQNDRYERTEIREFRSSGY